jgi:ferritin
MADISKTMQDAFNEQIKNEFASAYLYLAMSVWCESEKLPGAAHWMRAQFIEEQTHALKMADFVLERGGVVNLHTIAQPTATFKSVIDVFEQTLAHERVVTELINKLYDVAVSEKDLASQVFLQWFVSEQVEEEKNATEKVDQFKAIGSARGMLVMFDGHLEDRKASLSVG